MKWIEKCPHCGHTAHIQIDVRNSHVSVDLLCDGCDAIFKCTEYLNEEFMKGKTIPEVVNECLTDVLERWNKRAEEPQERKESNVEWALNEIKKGTFFYNVCKIAHLTKWGTPCVGDCDECEFCNVKNAIDYLLAPYED